MKRFKAVPTEEYFPVHPAPVFFWMTHMYTNHWRDTTTKIKIAQVGLSYWQRGVCCSSLWRMQVNKIRDQK